MIQRPKAALLQVFAESGLDDTANGRAQLKGLVVTKKGGPNVTFDFGMNNDAGFPFRTTTLSGCLHRSLFGFSSLLSHNGILAEMAEKYQP